MKYKGIGMKVVYPIKMKEAGSQLLLIGNFYVRTGKPTLTC